MSSSNKPLTSVKVAVRIRPTTTQDSHLIPSRWQNSVVEPSSNSSINIHNSSFSFDRVHGPSDTQNTIYNDNVDNLVNSFVDGYNVTILAYGQTSSGKSYTMGTCISDSAHDTSIDSSTGIVPRAVDHIFHSLDSKGVDFSLKNSFVEIYNEDLVDLLGPIGVERPPVTIREASNGTIIWSGLREPHVASSQDVLNNLYTGSNVRQTNETEMNAKSSRSHAIFSLTLTQKKYVGPGHPPQSSPNPPSTPRSRPSSSIAQRVASPSFNRPSTPTSSFKSGLRPPSSMSNRSPSPAKKPIQDEDDGNYITITSKFHFVDLAGSERLKRTAAEGARASEAISINSGLLALGNVISALGDPSKARAKTYIPYRDSKLTRLLQDSLGGNAQTTMIACVSPAEYNTSETINTLKYANRARNIKNKAEVNQVDAGWEDIEWLQSTVTKLRKELGTLRAGKIPDTSSSTNSSKEQVEHLENKYEESTSELENLRLQLSNAEDSPNVQQKASSFAEMVAPVIEEYERTINTLESELKLTKAAVSHTNMVYSERESEFDELADREANQTNLIEQLHGRLQKLITRESTTEAYVKDLESQLKVLTEGDESSAAALADIRKELAKHRELESKNEQYILDVESKLNGVEHLNSGLVEKVEMLEKEAHERDEQLEQLELRLNLYNDGDDSKAILATVDKTNAKHAHMEVRLEELINEREKLFEESTILRTTAEQEGFARNDALRRLGEVESEKTKIATAFKLEGGKINTNGIGNGVKEITPPNTPGQSQSQDEHILKSELVELRVELQKIQMLHKKTLNELDTLQSRYRDALKEIGELTGQIEEHKLINTNEDGVIATGSQPATHIVDQSTGKLRRKLSFESGGITLPSGSGAVKDVKRNSISIPRRNSLQNLQSPTNLARTSAFFGRQPLVTGGGNGGATTSAATSATTPATSSMTPATSSTPPPSAPPTTQKGNGHARTPSLLLSQELSSHRQSRSSWAGPPSPGVSPRLSMNNSPSRSIESLEREIQTLQKTLKDRDDEIDMLEKEIPQLKRASSAKEVEGTGSDVAFESHSHSHSDVDGDKDADIKQEHIARFNELMTSMAIKESAHSEQIERLKSSYDLEKRQNEDLKSLTKMQITNMSTEVEAYRNQLEGRDNELKKLEESLEEAEKEFTTAKKTLTDAHSIELASVKAKHQEVLYNTNLEYDKMSNKTEKDVERESLIEKIKMSHENSLNGIKKEYKEVVNVLKSSNESLIKEVEEVKNRMTSNHEETISELRRKQKDELERASLLASDAQSEMHDEYAKVIEGMRKEYDEKVVSDRERQDVANPLEEELRFVKESMQGQQVETIKLKEQLSNADAERDERAGNADEVAALRSQLQMQKERNESDQKNFAEALQTIEGAINERDSLQVERDELQAEVNDFTSRNNSYEYQQLELTRSKEEISSLTHDRLRLESALKDYENVRMKENELQSPVLIDAAPKSPRLSRGNSGGSNVPPPTPPPSIPPPPPPQNGKQRQSTSSRPESAASIRSQNEMHPESIKQLEEAEQQIKTLTKQLDHCEADLQANIDLVQTLENALMDSERSLRKARVNMNDLVKDRDMATAQVTQLRQEIDSKQQEIDSTRHSVVEERRQSALKLDQERSQRDRARAQLEQRVEDMQKRKSKLRCF
ncbi:Kinesin-like protein KIF21A [Wallemia ichthyophaga EXF-994]|uniref:Kinesin-like protein KIF21A n=1 Tax=Wallemia ichthyophaga (strain EXF-994 / CBS 113033) TaxID=1299270 RepID=R9A9S7_WALI9|nr:Kinesin-like protein KIF21A [Wallemia ichthyophaga EXF-994]EOQ98936.1 Kinesin-like protein KIF21A [Wallemia ichthyophaga EXF-994]